MPIATTTMSQSITNSEPSIGTGRRRPESSGSPSSIRWQRRPRDPALLVAEHLERRDQEVEEDALLLGVVDLLGARGELVVRAAVDDPGLGRPEPPRRPDRVHRDVAAADHDDPLAVEDRRVRARGSRRPSG